MRIPSGDIELDAYLAVPTGPGPWPGVVLVHDIFGFRGDVKDQADHLAAAGYLAVAPSLYSRGSKPGCLIATMKAGMSGVGPAFADLDASRRWLAARDDCTGRVGILGFCIGGNFAMLCAPRYDFDAASVNYGMVPDDAEQALAGCCPVVGSWGAHDKRLRGSAQRVQAALDALGVPNDTREYPSVGHGFLNRLPAAFRGERNPLAMAMGVNHHDPAAVEDAWRRILAFFGEHLGGAALGRDPGVRRPS